MEVLALPVLLFLVLLAILWCVLPFAVFGVKGRMDQLQRELRMSNQLLSEVVRLLNEEQERGHRLELMHRRADARAEAVESEPR